MEESAVQRALHLRQKARELRVVARGLKNFESRATLLCLAEDYEKLSQHAEHWDQSGAPVGWTRLYG